MTGDDIRAAFLNFFKEKGHDIVPSASLVPQGDPTLLLTSAGMVPFKPYFLGELTPPNPRLASCQKCFRATDIDEVGDSTHLTFFEMLGNFSIGDYFKDEAVAWGWEFVTERLKMPIERLWITIYTDDDEAFACWRKVGVAEDRIVRCGDEHNFWGPAGDRGPCGPCSEIHYDFGPDVGCGKPSCGPACDCGRFSEIWNLVFTQYNQGADGKRSPLPKPNIDTGMGLERVAAIMQGVESVYDTDFFAPLIQGISDLTGIKYGGGGGRVDNAMRVVAEHARGLAFLITDGVLPANEGRGYVLRRLLRRAVVFGRRLDLTEPFLVGLADLTIKNMNHIYPELAQGRHLILKTIEMEEERFDRTLDNGLSLLDELMPSDKAAEGGVISGGTAFQLYDTYGLPVEVTQDIAADRGLEVDMEGFEREMAKQRQRAQDAHRFACVVGEEAGLGDEFGDAETPFVGYESLGHHTNVLAVLIGGESVDGVEEGKEAGVVLASTPFYAEMGGQVGDSGIIKVGSGSFQVDDTVRLSPDVIVHRGRMAVGLLKVGDKVEACVDEERRLDIARNHTATHLLHFALRRVLGEHVQQRGSLVSSDRLRFDFSHLNAMMAEEILEVNRIVNAEIRRNLSVSCYEKPYREALDEGAIALFDEKYADTVRVVSVGDPSISSELCGGTHVIRTGDIGFFRILSEGSIGAGLRRIEAVTGSAAERFVEHQGNSLHNIADTLEASPDEVEGKVAGLVAELGREHKRVQSLERELSVQAAAALMDRVEEVKGVKVLVAEVPSARGEVLREMSDRIRDGLKSAIIVLGSVHKDRPLFVAAVTPDLIEKGYNAGDIVRSVAKEAGGGGGGKPHFAQAGGKDKAKISQALRLVKSLV